MNVTTTNKKGTAMDINNFCAELRNTATTTNDDRIHFYVPPISLLKRYHCGNELFGTVDTTTFTNEDTGEEIITVPSNIKEISTWDDWKKTLKISKHSPVYRVIKAIFDGEILSADHDDEDTYEMDFVEFISGYEIM